MFHAKVIVRLRKSILDPQGKAIEHGMHSLGYKGIQKVRMGKYVELDIQAKGKEEAERIAREVSDKLLANPVMEDFSITVEETEERTLS